MKNSNKDFEKNLTKLAALDGKTVCVAFSGGADSVCLLYLLNSVKDKYNFKLTAAHVNHNIRGKEALRDALFCKDFCLKQGIEFTLFNIDVPRKLNKGESLEEGARRLRYNALNTLNFDYLATAHHLDDNIETFIINSLRGTGLKGLCGIPEIRDKIIRPLLNMPKSEILSFCNENNLKFVTDSTNETEDYTRNNIRHKIIPLFERINPSFREVFKRNFDNLKSDEDYISEIAAKNYKNSKTENGLSVSSLKTLHTALLSRIIKMYIFDETGIIPDQFHIEKFAEIIFCNKGNYELSKGYFCKVKNGIFSVERNINIEYSVEIEKISIEKFNNYLNINNLFLQNAIDCDKIFGSVSVRTRKEGDCIKENGRGVTKKIRKLQQEKNIPLNLRNKMPIAADEKGVLWGYKLGIDQRAAVDNNTKNVLIFKVNEDII